MLSEHAAFSYFHSTCGLHSNYGKYEHSFLGYILQTSKANNIFCLQTSCCSSFGNGDCDFSTAGSKLRISFRKGTSRRMSPVNRCFLMQDRIDVVVVDTILLLAPRSDLWTMVLFLGGIIIGTSSKRLFRDLTVIQGNILSFMVTVLYEKYYGCLI